MSRRRLTREETREQTTQRLLDAAAKVIARKGLEGTSVEDIAEAAGYSRGAFYSNFSSKEDLFIEMLRRDHAKASERLLALRSDELTLDQLEAGCLACYSSLYSDNENFMNWAEARLLAVRDPRFRSKLTALLTQKTSQVAEFIEYFYSRLGVSPAEPPQMMALAFMSLVEGVKLAMLSSPTDMPPAAAESVLTLFARSVIEAAKARREAAARQRDAAAAIETRAVPTPDE